jgi:acetate kinase
MLASLSGCDVLAFTDVVGESSAFLRSSACEPFAFLGLRIDERKNQELRAMPEISSSDFSIRVYLIHSRESWQVGDEACRAAKRSER